MHRKDGRGSNFEDPYRRESADVTHVVQVTVDVDYLGVHARSLYDLMEKNTSISKI